MRKNIIFFILIILFINGCSIQKMAIRSMNGILDNSMTALYEESDLKIAEQAIASDLKLIEGLLKSDPENEQLLFLACQGFSSYALGFVEDDDPERAKLFYLRAKNYGLELLFKKNEFKNGFNKDIEQFQKALKSFHVQDVPALFWTAFSWSSWINLSFTNTQALADLPKVQIIMERVIELEERFFYGGAHLFFATIYAARPPILGGDMKKANEHFEKCFQFADKKFLLPYVYYAKYYATRELDQELFENTLNNVLQTPDDIIEDQKLPNAIAKQKARKLLTQIEDFF